MTGLLPDSLFGRAVVILIAGLALTHLLSMAIHYADREHRLSLFGAEGTAEKMAAVADALMRMPASERAPAAASFAAPDLAVEIGGDAPAGEAADWRARTVGAWLAEAFPRAEIEARALAHPFCPGPRADGAACAAAPDSLVVVFRARGRGEAAGRIVLAAPLRRVDRAILARMAVELLIMGIGIVALSIWAARWLTRPLRSFAETAERLGRDLRAPPVAEAGPREIRGAAVAFNAMQRRLRRVLDGRTRMLAAISHDLRTPITRLRLRAEFIDDAEEQRRMLGDLDDMERMIDSALAFARDEAESEMVQPIDLTALIESACHEAEDAGHEVRCLGTAPGAFRGRPLALKRGFANLIANAVKYGRRAEVRVCRNARELVVEIADHGPGLPPDELERVFEPFYRGVRSRNGDKPGTGLGLALARSVFRGHGGEVRLENRAEGGLRAIVTLPS